MLIIYYPINLVYIPTVRSGSTSTRRYVEKTLHKQYYNYHIARSKENIDCLQNNFYIHTSINEVNRYVKGNFKFFTTIRNPFEKLVSYYESRYTENLIDYKSHNLISGPNYSWNTFEEFLYSVYNTHGHIHLDKNLYYLNNAPACNHYIKTEDLYNELDCLLKDYNIYVPNIEQKTLNSSKRNNVKNYFNNDKLIDLVYKSYKHEIDMFGYSLD